MRIRSRPCKLRPGQSVLFRDGASHRLTEVGAGQVTVLGKGTFRIWDFLERMRTGDVAVKTCRFQ